MRKYLFCNWHNKTLHSDFNRRPPLKSGLVPEIISFQLCGERDVTGIAGIPVKVLLSKQLMSCRKGNGADITIKAGELCR